MHFLLLFYILISAYSCNSQNLQFFSVSCCQSKHNRVVHSWITINDHFSFFIFCHRFPHIFICGNLLFHIFPKSLCLSITDLPCRFNTAQKRPADPAGPFCAYIFILMEKLCLQFTRCRQRTHYRFLHPLHCFQTHPGYFLPVTAPVLLYQRLPTPQRFPHQE